MNTPASFERLPDNIVLEILNYLSLKDLCVAGSVCTRWRKIANDYTLWRHVNLLPYQLDLNRMWKVLRAHFSHILLSLKLRGFLYKSGPMRWKKPSLSDAMLIDLQERCPNITELCIHHGNIDKLDANNLPESLTKLELNNCSWPPRWLKNLDKPGLLPKLHFLDVSGCARVDNFDLEDFCNRTNMKVLKINRCYRVNEIGLERISRNLTDLEELEISETNCSELAVHHISRHLSKLRTLNLQNCSAVSDSCLQMLASSVIHLEKINLANCKHITADGIINGLGKLKSLKTIIIEKSFFMDERLAELQKHFPEIELIEREQRL